MSARDDYPTLAGFRYCAAALDEIDQLRAELMAHETEAEFLRNRVTDLAARLTDEGGWL